MIFHCFLKLLKHECVTWSMQDIMRLVYSFVGGVLYAVNGPAFSGLSDTSVQGFTLDIRTGALLETWNIPQVRVHFVVILNIILA